jgi:hypothetical protein
VKQRPVTQAIIGALSAAGIPVGDGTAADNGGWNDTLTEHDPYVVVFPIAGGDRFGTLQDWEGDATAVYQVTCVAPTQGSAESLVDDVGTVMASLNGATAGTLKIALVRNDFGTHQVRRADDVEPAEPVLFYGTPRYRLWLTKG